MKVKECCRLKAQNEPQVAAKLYYQRMPEKISHTALMVLTDLLFIL
jgi:hypothetical protein